MKLERMLEMCKRDQWKVGDLDWSKPPRKLSQSDEIAIVQLFTDMAGIERMAGALFEEQRRKTTDPVLREIFATFVTDEVRHAHAAQMLADYYDVHKFQAYLPNPALTRFYPHFVSTIRFLSPEIATVYITTGELILDVALLRSINDYVADDMSQQAMDLINRDESRHIAIDFHMTEYYASKEYLADLEKEPKRALGEQLRAWAAFAGLFYYARPFFKSVFFEPMDLVDPSGKRIKEAFKRMQLLSLKDGVLDRPFPRFLDRMRLLFEHPVAGPILGPAIVRLLGVDPRFIATLYDSSDAERAKQMSFDDLAQEALSLKYTN
ncbi:MAG: ferritin-like domain-containing protein [bacterium]